MTRLAKLETDRALELLHEALGLYRAVGDRLSEANTLRSLGNLHFAQEDDKKAQRRLGQALALYRQIGSLVGQANVYWVLGMYLAKSDRLQEAEPLLTQAVELGQRFAPEHPVTVQHEQVLARVRAQSAEE